MLEIIDRAREAQKKAQESSGAGVQPEAQAPAQCNNNAGPQDQSISDLRKQQMLEFKSSNKETTIPNILGRYPIFEPVKTGRRKYNPEWTQIKPFHSINEDKNIQIWQRYKLLNQHDCTVYLILRQYADSALVTNLRKYKILKKMKLYKEGANYTYVENALDRLFGTQYKIKYMDRYIYKDALIQRHGEDMKAEGYIIQLSKALDAFLFLDSFSRINLEQRLELGQNQSAQALHLYFSTNKCPERGMWFSYGRDFWPFYGKNYKQLVKFVGDFRKRVLKPLKDREIIKQIQENNTKTAVCIKW